VPITCEQCGASALAIHGKKRFCSDLCYSRWERAQKAKDAVPKSDVDVTCLQCAAVFPAKTEHKRFCGNPCYRRWKRAQVKAQEKTA
jgi:protein-arginine kinase activator protein McsA